MRVRRCREHSELIHSKALLINSCGPITMLDIALLRKDADAVARRLADRGYQLDIDAFRALEAERKSLQVRTETLQARRNALSKAIGQARGRGEDTSALMAEVAGIGAELDQITGANEAVQARLNDWLLQVPNVPHDSVPTGVTRPITLKFDAGACRVLIRSRSVLQHVTMSIWANRWALTSLRVRVFRVPDLL